MKKKKKLNPTKVPVIRNFVAKYMNKFNRANVELDKTVYKRKSKHNKSSIEHTNLSFC